MQVIETEEESIRRLGKCALLLCRCTQDRQRAVIDIARRGCFFTLVAFERVAKYFQSFTKKKQREIRTGYNVKGVTFWFKLVCEMVRG